MTPCTDRPGTLADHTHPSELVLSSPSRAIDAGHLAAADIAAVADAIGADYRLIGGNAISLLVWCHGASHLVPPRETADADLGAPPEVVAAPGLIGHLAGRGYRQEGGNRFLRTLDHGGHDLTVMIDVLAPSYGSAMKNNRPHGELFVDEIPGLGLAIAREPTTVAVRATLTTGADLHYTINLPELLSALCMKAYAYRWRLADRDALDIWRLLETANHAGLTGWPNGVTGREAAAILHQHFTSAAGGVTQATPDRTAQARIRALVTRLVPKPGW